MELDDVLTKVLVLSDTMTNRMTGQEEVSKQKFVGVLENAVGRRSEQFSNFTKCEGERTKTESPSEYAKQALGNLQKWNDESATTTSSSDSASSASFNSSATSSKYFFDALQQLRKADSAAKEILTDKKRQAVAPARVEALNICLFSSALLNYDNKGKWFNEWRRALDTVFDDRNFVRVLLGEQQGFVSKFFHKDQGKQVSDRFVHLTKYLESLICQLLLKQTALAPAAREFVSYYDFNTTLAPDVGIKPLDWKGINLANVSFTDNIELNLCDDLLVVKFYGFGSVTAIGREHLWAIDVEGQLFDIETKDPKRQMLIEEGKKKRWVSIGYASEMDEIYVTSERDSHISVFNASTRKKCKEQQIDLPIGPSATEYRMRVASNGTILLQNKVSGQSFVRFSSGKSHKGEGSTAWVTLRNGNYDVIASAGDKTVFGLRATSNTLIADLIQAQLGADEVAPVTVAETKCFPSGSKNCVLAIDQCGSRSKMGEIKITAACQTDSEDFIVDVLLSGKAGGSNAALSQTKTRNVAHRFLQDSGKLLKKRAREMVQADEKLFVLFW